ncbi:MAG: hypothetical protein K5786_07210 [Treponema sp.]|nr:hypothetical protein [Treponema sp.]
MGRIGKLIKTEIEKFIIATVETRFKYNQTADFYAASGDDAPPLEKDRIALVGIDGTGNFAAIGVLMVSQGAKPGERILYSRDEDGNPQAVLKLLGDGKIEAVSPGGVKVSTDDNYELEVKKDMSVKVDGNTKFSGKLEITGGNMKCTGTATPSGTGCFCALPTCPVTGAPHTGEMVMNT